MYIGAPTYEDLKADLDGCEADYSRLLAALREVHKAFEDGMAGDHTNGWRIRKLVREAIEN